MIKSLPIGIVVVAICLATPVSVSADTVVRGGDLVSVETNQLVESDFYAYGQSVSVSGKVDGDVYAVARTVTINGDIAEDISAAALSVQIHGSTSDDVRVVAGETVIAGPVAGDVFVIGGLLKVLSSANIQGDVFFYGGEAEISGPVAGGIMGTADRLRVDTSVGGSVDVTARQSLTLGDQAAIAGGVSYRSTSELERGSGAVVEGDIVAQGSATELTETNTASLIFFLSFLFAVLTLYLFFKRDIESFAAATTKSVATAGLIGLAMLFCMPLIAVLLIVIELGAVLGILVLLMYLVLLVLSFLMMSFVLASLLNKWLFKQSEISLLILLTGALGVLVLSLIPFFGSFVVFVLFIITLGGFGQKMYRLIS